MKHHCDKVDFPLGHQAMEFDKFTEKGLLRLSLAEMFDMHGTLQIVDKIL